MNEIKMLEPIRLKKDIAFSGSIEYEGLFQIVSRFDMDKKGGMCKIVRSMTYDSKKYPTGESAILPYGMVCEAFEQVQISAVN